MEEFIFSREVPIRITAIVEGTDLMSCLKVAEDRFEEIGNDDIFVITERMKQKKIYDRE